MERGFCLYPLDLSNSSFQIYGGETTDISWLQEMLTGNMTSLVQDLPAINDEFKLQRREISSVLGDKNCLWGLSSLLLLLKGNSGCRPFTNSVVFMAQARWSPGGVKASAPQGLLALFYSHSPGSLRHHLCIYITSDRTSEVQCPPLPRKEHHHTTHSTLSHPMR